MLWRSTRVLRQHAKPTKYIPPSEKAIEDHLIYAKRKKTRERIGKYIQYTVGGLVGTSILMYLWQPWNPYSVEVSKDLRKGLWEERESHDDYLKALKHYQIALKTANQEGMDQLSLKYTGIILKVAEMYQNLGMHDRLIETYYKLSEFIFLNLIDGKRSIAEEDRELLIDRDLIVITRWAMLMEENKKRDWLPQVESELKDRMAYIENHEIPPKFPWLYSGKGTKDDKIPDLIDLITIWANPQLKNKWIEDHVADDEGKEFLQCWDIMRSFSDKEWPKWIHSYLKLRQFYADLQMKQRKYPECIQILQSNILWSIVGNLDTPRGTGVQILNLASCWFDYGQFNDSKIALDRSKSIYLKLSNVLKGNPDQTTNLAMTYYSLGVQFQFEGKEKESLEYFEHAKELALELGTTQIIEKIDDNILINDSIKRSKS